MNPRYPIFIPSKGRWESRLTMKALDKINVPYKVFVEPQEYDNYAAVIDNNRIITLPHQDKGLVVTRNWIWDYATKLEIPRFWTMDDNISQFLRLNRNIWGILTTGTFLYVLEDFIERYENISIAGMNYFMFVPRKQKKPPFTLNTRIYSNMLIKTDIPFRNEGFYNDDTDLCLRILKAGWCTILFNMFVIRKQPTMTIKGGMTPHYQGDGRLKMAQELQQKHPDVVKITCKWGRWQHQVDYRPFKKNKLVKKEGIIIPDEPNEYGMKLVRLTGT